MHQLAGEMSIRDKPRQDMRVPPTGWWLLSTTEKKMSMELSRRCRVGFCLLELIETILIAPCIQNLQDRIR